MHTTEEAKCPYCNNILPKIPKRKTKCKFCGNCYYIRTRCSDRKKVIVTEQEIDVIEREWSIYYLNTTTSPSYLISEEEFQEAKKISLAKGNELSIELLRDITWGLLNKRLMSEMRQGNWAAMGQIYYEMAQFTQKEGKDCFHLLQEAIKCRLRDYKQQGIEQVEISSAGQGNACETCHRQNGKRFTIKQALEIMPIPVEKCSTEVFTDGKGFCRCDYIPYID